MKEELLSSIDNLKIPNHVAIIMDGNGRWAKKRGMLRTFGHSNALKSVKNVIEAAGDLGIKYLTLYAFSTENWNRPQIEVNTLMNLLSSSLKKELSSLMENNIRVKVIGNKDLLPKNVKEELEKTINITQNNSKATLILALNYGSRQEITNAIKLISQKIELNEIKSEDITENLIEKYLYTEDIPDVDLMIRTSGEQRISNFLLWQIAYSELYFTEVLWPDFSKEDFYKAILEYQNRERRFGKTSEQL